jgi:hypothetical protein
METIYNGIQFTLRSSGEYEGAGKPYYVDIDLCVEDDHPRIRLTSDTQKIDPDMFKSYPSVRTVSIAGLCENTSQTFDTWVNIHVLPFFPQIRQLSLHNCCFVPSTYLEIGEAIRANSNLTKLHICNPYVRGVSKKDSGSVLVPLFASLPYSLDIFELYLAFEYKSDIMTGLSNNTSLVNLSAFKFRHDTFDSGFLPELSRIVQNNRRLEYLRIRFTNISTVTKTKEFIDWLFTIRVLKVELGSLQPNTLLLADMNRLYSYYKQHGIEPTIRGPPGGVYDKFEELKDLIRGKKCQLMLLFMRARLRGAMKLPTDLLRKLYGYL